MENCNKAPHKKGRIIYNNFNWRKIIKRFLLRFNKFIGSQFGKPRGIAGKISCLVMNIMNMDMYKSIIKYIKREITSVSGNKNIKILDIGYGNG